METVAFWREELRAFPHGCRGAAVWVVRRRNSEVHLHAVQMLLGWASGRALTDGLQDRPPMSTLLKAMERGQEELLHRTQEEALWVEPLFNDSRALGCLGIWFDAPEPWREAIFLWGQRLGARLAPVLDQLVPQVNKSTGAKLSPQLTLFPSSSTAVGFASDPGSLKFSPRPGAKIEGASGGKTMLLPLPRPATIPGVPGCVGASSEMRRIGLILGDVARSGANVLLRGESGTGKEIIARALHHCSDRSSGPFIGQNCAALPESLFESELFGHRAGAFTGAAGDKLGLLAAANGGTFFLDEIGDMPLPLQIKLLRVMQERRVRRIGELQSRPVDLRFIAASHKDIAREIHEGRFRLDLFYRLKVISLEIPPLRQRPEDIAHLFAYFLQKNGKTIDNVKITEKALACLQAWRWPGNVRELENEAQRFLALHPGQDLIYLRHLSPEVQAARSGNLDFADLATLRHLDQANELLERYLIRKAIAATDGRKAAAARRLGLSRQGLYKKIQRYGMTDLIGSADS